MDSLSRAPVDSPDEDAGASLYRNEPSMSPLTVVQIVGEPWEWGDEDEEGIPTVTIAEMAVVDGEDQEEPSITKNDVV